MKSIEQVGAVGRKKDAYGIEVEMNQVSKRIGEWKNFSQRTVDLNLIKLNALIALSYMLITLYATLICVYTHHSSLRTKCGFFFKLCLPSMKRIVPLL